jgi:hypothetical protein
VISGEPKPLSFVLWEGDVAVSLQKDCA